MMLQTGLGALPREIRRHRKIGNFYLGMPIPVLNVILIDEFQATPTRVGYRSLNGSFVVGHFTMGCL